MANINILDKSIFSRIAAGEVVEKPASVVKELVENSIDAKSTNITIEISNGGIKKIKVSDNGIGMDAENLPKAFLPHATSKVSTVNDLEKIGTLGFRGEALSSIASVAKITAISKTKNNQLGTKIEIESGEIINTSTIGASDGTTIIVEDLFYSVPARAKFLRKPKTEENDITNIVSRLILSHPNIVFKYVVDDKIIYLSTGNGLFEAIYTVYGKNTVDNLIPVNYVRDDLEITGYIGKPTFSKANRTYQTLIINNRYVINQTIASAVGKAYESFLMKGNFAFYVLNFNIPLDKIDVNVHPNKLDVKFEDGGRIFGLFLNTISNILLNSTHVKDLSSSEVKVSDDNIKDEVISLTKYSQSSSSNSFGNIKNFIQNSEQETNSSEKSEHKHVELLSDELEKKREELAFFLTKDSNLGGFQTLNQDYGFSYDLAKQALENEKKLKESSLTPENIKLFDKEENKIIGVAFGTYIIVEQAQMLYFIDQHAAHERILYEKFKNQLLNREIVTQQLLVPYILDVNHLESEFLSNNLSAFNELGFDIENFGANSFKVSTTPLLFKDISINSFFNLVLKEMNSVKNITSANIIEGYLARSACRTAVKANDRLSDFEINKLLEDLNHNEVLLCPHGRPIVIKITNTEIEKWFKRIV